MAVFQLYLGEPRGEAILRHKDRLARPDGTVDVTSDQVHSLGIELDPYVSFRVWSHQALDALIAELDQVIATWRAAARQAVLEATHRRVDEPWMAPMIETRIAEDSRIETAASIVALFRAASEASGTVVYQGD
jgi:hypothetical protein